MNFEVRNHCRGRLLVSKVSKEALDIPIVTFGMNLNPRFRVQDPASEMVSLRQTVYEWPESDPLNDTANSNRARNRHFERGS
jgi:hypothetical protein